MDKKPSISVIIISYKCLSVLRIMLTSLRASLEDIDNEVIVVDNASLDGTAEHLQEHFSWVKVIASDENLGFSKANNIAIRQCRGDIVLLLNPDTIVPKSFVREVINHFETHPKSGAIGVQMTNSEGYFLKESKRGYTDIRTSFFKITGLWKFFPKSKVINAYYVGDVDRNEIAKVPILSGACMAFSRELMQQVGLLDEGYFMYGEDIDLSWRMHCASDGNTYIGTLNIIHFKGMSTPRHLRYIHAFYFAMKRFARKYEYPKHNKIINSIVSLGINMAFCLGCIKCILLKIKDNLTCEKKPNAVTFISDNEQNKEAFVLKNRDLTVFLTHDMSEVKREVKHIVFDVESDINMAIAYMKANKGRHKYSFYSRPEDVILSK